MCKKLICLVSLAFVLGSVWTHPTEAADANLVGWWKFDGDGLDSSGNGRHGTLSGDAHYTPGYLGQALALDGDGDYFTVDGYLGVFSASPVSVTAWVNTTDTGELGDIAYWGRSAGRRRVDFRINAGRLRVEHGSGNLQGDTSLNDGEWHHVALTMPALAPVSHPPVSLWLDGQDDSRNTLDPEGDIFELVDDASNVDLTFGYRVPNGDRYFNGMLDDIRMYDRELSGPEIRDIMTLGYLASPHSPIPGDGEKVEDTWGTLTWSVGPLATSHDFYFSTSFDDVNDRTEAAFVGNITADNQAVGFPGFPAPDGLAPGTTYYWRVDEINETHPDSPWRGDVWSFWIPPTTAYDPVPGDGEPAEMADVDLSWSLGVKSIMNAVYFGTNADQVANAAGAPPHMTPTYDPGQLADATRYYWRVDTFNGAQWVKGPLWTFATRPVIPVSADPNLVAWWKLDEGAGTNVLDWSGNGNDGKLFLGPEWTGAEWSYDGDKALTFVDDAYVAIDGVNYSGGGRTEVTVCAWVRTSDPNDQYILSFDRNEYYRLQVNGEVAGPGQIGWHVMTINGGVEQQLDYGSVTRVDDGLWHHITGVFKNGTSTIFIDGLPEPPAVGGPTYGIGDLVRYGFVGANSEATGFNGARGVGTGVTGDLGDLRIYDKALTQEEILAVMRGDSRMAWDLRPTNGRIVEAGDVTSVTWRPGDGASQHDVYFGTDADADAVASADASDTSGVYRGRQSTTAYRPSEGFDWGRSYYWRVDEVGSGGSLAAGRVRAVNVADYLTVEDFEDYNDYPPDEIWNTWIDGFGTTNNGAVSGYADPDFMVGEHYVETVTVRTGRQALPLFYDNNLKFSEASRTFAAAGDWTRHGVEELTLWYFGDPCNVVAERMYVAVTGGGTAVVYNDDPNLVANTWTEWVIPLQTLVDQGVNIRSVTGIALGFGTRANATTPGGSGVVFFDDIRLRRAPVIPVITIAPADTFEATGDNGTILSINGTGVDALVLGTTTFAGEPKHADFQPPDADNFDLSVGASADDQAYVQTLFAVPVTKVLVVEKGGNDSGYIQSLDQNGLPVGEMIPFSPADFSDTGLKGVQNQVVAAAVVAANAPIYGIRVLPPDAGVLGFDPTSVSAVPSQ